MACDGFIQWSVKTILSHFLYPSNVTMKPLFGAIFPESEVGKQYTMNKDKVSYFVLYGIALVFKEELITTVNKSPFYSIGFNESLNHMLQDNQMDIHIRFWDSEKSQAETRFLTSMFLKKATTEDLRQELLHGIMNLDPKKMSMLSMDGLNVNWLILKLVNEHRKLNELAKLIPTGLYFYFSFRNKLDIVFINS